MFTNTMSESEIQHAYQQTTQQFAASLQGNVVLPGDPDYESARGVWNGAIDYHPAIIVRPINVVDIITAIDFARQQSMEVAVRSGGHSVAGYSTIDNGMVMDLSRMKSITFDAERRIARLEPGLTWGEVANTLQPYGLALTSGDTSSVGVGGLLLGGGIGWMVRKYGLAIDRLHAVELVTADSQFLRASADENPELFWGLRGGGGNFGVVTAFEVDLHAAGMVVGGAVFYDAAEAESIMRAYTRYAEKAPDELITMAMFMAAPPAPFIPPEKQGMPSVSILVCYTGDLAEGERVVVPLRSLGTSFADIIAPMPFPVMFALTEEATAHGLKQYVRSMFLQELDDEAIHTIVQESVPVITPEMMVQIRILGDAMSKIPTNMTAFAHRDKHAMVSIFNSEPNSAPDADRQAHVEHVWQALRPYADGVYVNFLGDEGERRIHEAYPSTTYARLAVLKKLYDPTNMFHLNQNIPPVRTGMLAA